MSKTKKILALALSAAMALSLLAGCGGGEEATPQTPAAATPQTPAATPAAAGFTG